MNVLCRQTRRWCSTLARARILDDGMVQCHWSDGSTGRFSLLWLRDHCPSKVHPDSGQRTVELRHIPSLSPAQIAVNEAGRTLDVNWPDAPSQSTFDSAWLWRHCADRRGTACATHNATVDSAATAAKVVPWSGATLRNAVPRIRSWAELVLADTSEREEEAALDCLRELRRSGFVVVSDVPPTFEATEQLATRLGRVQDTFYGALWDTAPRAVGEVLDTAYSNVELPLHTDCTYLKQQPGLQLFNCVAQAFAPASSPLDGSTRLADGFMAAEVLRRDYPATFAFFCRVALPFVHASDVSGVSMRHVAPVFERHPHTSEVIAFRYNELDRAPLGPPLSFDDVHGFYTHQAVLVQVLNDLEMPLRLEQGEAILIDNHRVLHGRYGFTGYRNMLGCYMTADDWQSRLRVLERKAAARQGAVKAHDVEELEDSWHDVKGKGGSVC